MKLQNKFYLEGKITWSKYTISEKGVHRLIIRILQYDDERERKHGYFITFFNKIAISVANKCKLNDSLNITGILNNNVFENKNGVLVSETQLIGLSYQLIDDIEIPIKHEQDSDYN